MGRDGSRSGAGRFGTGALLALLSLPAASTASAAVRHDGTWPAEDKKVSLVLDRVARDEALNRLADAAGWSIVVRAPSSEPLSLHIKDQPADKILDQLLSDTDYVARRDGNLISIERGTASAAPSAAAPATSLPAVPPAPAAPPVPPAPAMADAPTPPAPPAPPPRMKAQAKDREVFGNSLTIEKDEVVRDVHVVGGHLDVHGTVLGDAQVMGGGMTLEPDARVEGEVNVVGGTVTVKKGARIDGDVRVVGGHLEREEGSVIGGDVSTRATRDDDDNDREEAGFFSRTARSVGDSITASALLFALGAVLLALLPRRTEMLKVEIASRPARSFALGIVGSLGGIAVVVALCVTVLGIPIAVLGLLAAIFGVFGAMCSVLEVVGRALIGHRARSEYAHLALGCALFGLLGVLPWIGGFFKAAVVLIAIGSLVATRAAGFLKPKNGQGTPPDAHPYRTAEAL